MASVIALVLGVPLLIAATSPEAPDRLTVFVRPLQADGVAESTAQTVDSVLLAELARRPDLKVVSLADVNAVLETDKVKELLGCGDESCSAELGGALGADRMLVGRLGRLGATWVLSLRWLDVTFVEPVAASSQSVDEESQLGLAVARAVTELLDGARSSDEVVRERKRRPTFWTLELSAGVGNRMGPEPYELGLDATVRLAWGGHTPGSRTYFYVVPGLGFSRFSGSAVGVQGEIAYTRTDVTPFVEFRLAQPLGGTDRLRLLLGAGLGLDVERHEAKQSGGIHSEGWSAYPSFRGIAGFWYRLAPEHSLVVNYRLRVDRAGKGVDPISELVEIDSSTGWPVTHEVEAGWALHF